MLAIGIGAAAGALSVLQGALARTLQHIIYHLAPGDRLSDVPMMPLRGLIALPFGGALLVLFTALTRARHRAMVDAVEANALHGGRMSWSDSLVIAGQTIL